MSQSRAKKIRKQVVALGLKDPEKENKIYKHLKKLTNSNPVRNPELINHAGRNHGPTLDKGKADI